MSRSAGGIWALSGSGPNGGGGLVTAYCLWIRSVSYQVEPGSIDAANQFVDRRIWYTRRMMSFRIWTWNWKWTNINEIWWRWRWRYGWFKMERNEDCEWNRWDVIRGSLSWINRGGEDALQVFVRYPSSLSLLVLEEWNEFWNYRSLPCCSNTDRCRIQNLLRLSFDHDTASYLYKCKQACQAYKYVHTIHTSMWIHYASTFYIATLDSYWLEIDSKQFLTVRCVWSFFRIS